MHLTWSFDWPVRRAVAVANHGTYVIFGEGSSRWAAKFSRADSGLLEKKTGDLSRMPTYYASMADALRACQSHAERFAHNLSDRLMVNTPIP
jgi:hypothetical protein